MKFSFFGRGRVCRTVSPENAIALVLQSIIASARKQFVIFGTVTRGERLSPFARFVFDCLLFSASIVLTARIFGCRPLRLTPRRRRGADLYNPR